MMAKKYYTILFLFAGMLAFKYSGAQVDPHSSQYYMNPLYLNPANTGIFDGNYRLAAVYRNQWRGVTNAFSTVAFTGDVNTDKDINFGVNILNQSAGDAGYNFMNGYISVAYTGVKFGKGNNQRVSLGLQAGFINRRIDPSRFKLGDQWNPITGYNPAQSTSDVFTTSSSTAFDAGAGFLYYDGTPDKKANLYAGFSAFHLSRPKDPFIKGADKEVIPIRYAIHAGVYLTISDVVAVVPNLLYMRQGNAQEKMLGAYMQLKASAAVDFLVGANYRFNDAIAPFAGFTYNSFILGLSYDANVSDLGKMVSNTNNLELTLSYTGKKKNKINLNYLKCPRL